MSLARRASKRVLLFLACFFPECAPGEAHGQYAPCPPRQPLAESRAPHLRLAQANLDRFLSPEGSRPPQALSEAELASVIDKRQMRGLMRSWLASKSREEGSRALLGPGPGRTSPKPPPPRGP